VVLVILGMPIGIAVGAATLVVTLLFSAVNPITIPAQFVGLLTDSFILLAAPLFILAGNVAAASGVAMAVIDFATVLVGWMRGGLAYVNIVDSMIFGGISGSAVADVASLGRVLIPQMERKGYEREFATALTVSTAILAPIVPPSIIGVIFAWMAEESVAAIFAGGYIPGLLIGIGMAIPTYVISKRRNYPREPFPTPAVFLRSLWHALPGLMIPILIMGGILLGWFTPTEAAAVAVIYALTVPMFCYREMSWRDLPRIFADSARLTGVIGFIVGFVGAFGWVLTYSRVPIRMAAFIGQIAPAWWTFLLVVIALYVFLGTFLTPSEIILVTVPVLLPASNALNIHPIHFGMVCMIASAIGHITPPVGLCLFVGMAISGLTMDRLLRPLLPFITAILAVLILVAFVPELVLFLPRLLGLTK
jgi:C4-dicarboxylate transporter DctM subunit